MRHAALVLLASLCLATPAWAEGGPGNSTGNGAVREAVGVVSALSDSAISVRDGKRKATCSVADRSPSLTGIAVGDRIQMRCRRNVDGWVLVKIREQKPKPEPVKATGVVSALSDASITVERLTCSIPDRLAEQVGRLRVGDRVRIACVRGTLVGVERKAEDATPDQDPSATPSPAPSTEPTRVEGVLTSIRGDGLTVHSETGDVSCRTTDRSPGLAELHVGDRVKIACDGGVLVALARL